MIKCFISGKGTSSTVALHHLENSGEGVLRTHLSTSAFSRLYRVCSPGRGLCSGAAGLSLRLRHVNNGACDILIIQVILLASNYFTDFDNGFYEFNSAVQCLH